MATATHSLIHYARDALCVVTGVAMLVHQTFIAEEAQLALLSTAVVILNIPTGARIVRQLRRNGDGTSEATQSEQQPSPSGPSSGT